MKQPHIVIILSHPEESRNVGAVCRAMANSDIETLRIIGCRDDYDDTQVRRLAIHAGAIWDSARFFPDITEATADCMISFGTTRRRGKNRKGKLLLPEDFTEFMSRKPDGLTALVFGNERTGLTDSELAECTMGITIPSSDSFPSLNLSHAVQILCYHAYRAARAYSPGHYPVTLERIDQSVAIIADNLAKIGFFSVTGRTEMEHFWKDILARAALTQGEALYMEKIFTKTAGLASRNKNGGNTGESADAG